MRRFKRFPAEIADVRAIDVVQPGFSFKDVILFGESNVHNTYLDPDYISQCADKIQKHHLRKRLNTKKASSHGLGAELNESGVSGKENANPRSFNRLNNIFSKSAGPKKMVSFKKETNFFNSKTKGSFDLKVNSGKESGRKPRPKSARKVRKGKGFGSKSFRKKKLL